MALSTESPSLVRQKVYNTLNGASNSTQNGRLWWAAARELFNILQTRGAGNLQFVPFDAADTHNDLGIDAAHKIYMVYGKKRNTATDTFVRVTDDDEADSITLTQGVIELAYLVGDAEAAVFYPEGVDMANGLVVNQLTAFDGETEGAAADLVDGFIVIGA